MKSSLIILLLLFSYFMTSAQKKEWKALADSLLSELPKCKADTNKINILNELCYVYALMDIDKGLKYVKEALALSESLNWEKGQAPYG